MVLVFTLFSFAKFVNELYLFLVLFCFVFKLCAIIALSNQSKHIVPANMNKKSTLEPGGIFSRFRGMKRLEVFLPPQQVPVAYSIFKFR